MSIRANTDTQITVSGITEDLFYKWIRYIDATPKTIQTYTRAIKQFVIYLQDNCITNPTREDVLNYKNSLAEEHKPATVNLYLQSIKLFFTWLEQETGYPNIAKHIKPLRLDKGHKKDALSSTQAAKVLNGIDRSTEQGKRDFAILSLMLTTGLRTIEVCRANYEDLAISGDVTVLYVQGKGHQERTDYVRVPEQVEDAIRDYLKTRGKVEGGEPLFTSIANRNKGERMTTRSISRIVKDNLIEAGFNSDRLTAHSMRHTAACLNLLNGGTLEETMKLLRHTNPSTTMIYVHTIDQASNKSSDRVAGAIFGA